MLMRWSSLVARSRWRSVGPLDEHAPLGLGGGATRRVATAVALVLLIAFEGRAEDAHEVNVLAHLEAVPVVRPDDVEHAGGERPALVAGQIGDLTAAGDD